ncbi:hypothetical protein LCGC14_0870270 [marine sediment metagenome]|uniref:AB hydrolase-1 domain-containing protein n=1 Tax=marine sediment metagenome TaxID=412755 RepID=A0A0F9PQH8_9ZZZZ|nr:MAG: Alpha/beta hydrolase family protein [Candidatus Lokiarchaeum sp. GC14_75]
MKTEKRFVDQTISLRDGRKLGYIEYGNKEGKPVFYFHGHRSSRLEPKIYNIEQIKDKVNLIAIDRPGFGISDYTPKHSLLNWPDDIIEFANALNIDKFSILGGSGGAPFALACAYKIPKRLNSCGVVSGLGPIKFGIDEMAKNNKLELKLAQKYKWLLKLMFKFQLKYSKKLGEESVEEVLKKFQKRSNSLPEPDKIILQDKEKLSIYIPLMMEPFRQGIMGPFHEAKLFVKPWGFNLNEISPDIKIYLWHGELDTSVPKHMAQSVCREIPNCESKFYKNEAHLSTAVNHIEEILHDLIV